MTSNRYLTLFVACASVLFASPAPAAPGDAKIQWAKGFAQLSGSQDDTNIGAPGRNNLLGPPDLKVVSMPIENYAHIDKFANPVGYKKLYGLLKGSFAGDKPTLAEFGEASVIAFENNGGSPAQAGGWESSIWYFFKPGTTRIGLFDGSKPTSATSMWHSLAPIPGTATFLSGSIHCNDYAKFFKISSCGATPVISWILIKVPPEVHTSPPDFGLWLGGLGTPAGGDELTNPFLEGSPDADAIGWIRAEH